MILVGLAGSYIALIATISCLGAIIVTVPGLKKNDLWFVVFVDLLANWVLVRELISSCHFMEGVICNNRFGMEIATLRICFL
jgi:hypothetical protein